MDVTTLITDGLTASPALALGVLLAAGTSTPVLGGIAAGWLASIGLAAWKRMAGIAGAAGMGLGVSLYLGRQHHPSSGSSICNINEQFNCDVVNASPQSELFGIPIALLGAGFYAGVFAVSLLALSGRAKHERAAHAVLGGSLLSLVYSAYLAKVSMDLGVWCLFCISLYGVNAILAGASLLEARSSGLSVGAGIKEAFLGKEDRSVGAMSTAGAVIFIGAMLWYRGLGPAGPAPVAGAGGVVDYSTLYEPAPVPVRLGGSEASLGSQSASYTVVEFADFECPACGRISDDVKKLPEKHPDLRLLFKHYPLSNACNPSVQSAFHEHACGAAKAAECARQQGRFWELSRLMFKNQQYLSPGDLQTMAGQVSLDTASWSACLDQPATLSAISADIDMANSLGLTGTPSLYLHGLGAEGQWVKVMGGPSDVTVLVEAHKAGKLKLGS